MNSRLLSSQARCAADGGLGTPQDAPQPLKLLRHSAARPAPAALHTRSTARLAAPPRTPPRPPSQRRANRPPSTPPASSRRPPRAAPPSTITAPTAVTPRKRLATITAVPASAAARPGGLGPGPPTLPAQSPGDAYVLAVVLAYGLSSLGGVFVNKACLSAYQFGYTVTLMLCQLCVSVSALSLLRAAGVVAIPKRTLRELSVLIFPAVFFIANVTVGLLALKLVNIPMFSAFRRLSVLSVMLLEWVVLGKTATQRILITIFVMVLGSFLAGLGDLAFDPVGYFLVFLNNFITAANLVSIKKASAIVSLDALPLFYYVSLISLPIVLLLSLLSGELRLAIAEINARPDLQTLSFATALSLSAGSAFLINFFTNMCTQLTSPLTTAITGQMKNVLQTVLGIFAFGYQVTPLNLFGLAVALIGSLTFARFKYQDSQAAKLVKKPQSDAIPFAKPASSLQLPEKSSSGNLSSSEEEKTTLLRHTARHVSIAVGGVQSHEA